MAISDVAGWARAVALALRWCGIGTFGRAGGWSGKWVETANKNGRNSRRGFGVTYDKRPAFSRGRKPGVVNRAGSGEDQ